MSHARNLSLAFAGAALFASLPAAADMAPAAPTPVIIVQQGAPVPLATQPAAPAPAPVQPGYAPGYPPGGYPPGAYPMPYPGAYPAPYYGPGGYYAPGPNSYYAPRYRALPPTERQSVGAMAGGSVAIGAGGIMLFAALFVAVTPTCNFDSSNNGINSNCSDHSATVVGLTVAALAAIAVGIPVLIYGARRVPVVATAASTSPLRAVVGAPGGTGWRWSF